LPAYLSRSRPGSQALAQQRDARGSQRAALLVLQDSAQALVEVARGDDELVEALRRRLRPRQYREQRQPAVVLRVHGLDVEGPGARETRGTEHGALLLVGLVEDRKAPQHE